MDWSLNLYELAQCGQVAGIVIKEALGTDLDVEIHSEHPTIMIAGFISGLGLKAKMELKEEQTSEVQSTESLSFAL